MTHYVIVRSDLPCGFLSAQIVHAAGESSQGGIPPNTNAVVIAVENEQALIALAERLVQAGIAHVAVREPDPPYFGAYTAIGIAPVQDRSVLKRIVSKLPLYGKEYAVTV